MQNATKEGNLSARRGASAADAQHACTLSGSAPDSGGGAAPRGDSHAGAGGAAARQCDGVEGQGRKRLRTVLNEQALLACGRRARRPASAVPAGAVFWRAVSLEEHKESRMERIVTRAAPYLYAWLRILGALLYACHGAQKVLGLFGGVQ